MMGTLQGVLMLNFFNSVRSKQLSVNNKRGMTLIEILIVMALIAGLMAVLVSKIMPNLFRAERKQAEIKMKALMGQIEMYRTDCQRYPPALSALVSKPAECKNWGPEPYAKEADLQDAWGNEFGYENQNSTYSLKSFGKDGVEGGSGNAEDFTSESIQ